MLVFRKLAYSDFQMGTAVYGGMPWPHIVSLKYLDFFFYKFMCQAFIFISVFSYNPIYHFTSFEAYQRFTRATCDITIWVSFVVHEFDKQILQMFNQDTFSSLTGQYQRQIPA